jgi:hypothetical protein
MASLLPIGVDTCHGLGVEARGGLFTIAAVVDRAQLLGRDPGGGLRRSDRGLDLSETVTDYAEVTELNNKYFAPVWRITAPSEVFVADYLKPENQMVTHRVSPARPACGTASRG